MALQIADRVLVTSSTYTTSSFTLGPAITGYQNFSVLTNGNTTYYGATDNAGNWEVGLGTYTSATPALARTTIISSSNSGSVVTFTGTVSVFITYPAENAVYGSGTTLVAPSTAVLPYNNGGTGLSTPGAAGNVLTSNGTNWISAAGGIAWQSVQTSNFNATAGNAYPINTTSSGITVTLPASPTAGQQIQLQDYAGTFATNKLTINPNGNNIQSTSANYYLAINRDGVILTYIDSTQGWLVTTTSVAGLLTTTYTLTYLIAAGGGGGGINQGGGGGAGGLVTGSSTVTPGSSALTVTIGGGGGGQGQGSNSSVTGFTTAVGGGYGTNAGGAAGNPGGSGGAGGAGGGGSPTNPGGSGTAGQGNPGGYSPFNNPGGGGGAGATGSSSGGNNGNGAPGGVGLTTSLITTAQATTNSVGQVVSSSVYFCGGGGGANAAGSGSAAPGGYGGGASGGTNGNGSSANSNTGGGGGGGGNNGSSSFPGGSGGSGCVLLSMPTANYSGTTTGSPTVVTNGSNTVLIFKASGSYTP